jgi:site-specific recombinase XerD
MSAWEELLQAYAQARSLASATLRGYRKNLGYFLDFSAVSTPQDVTREHLRAYNLDLLNRPGLSEASVGARMRTVLSLLRWAVARERLLADPTDDFKVPKPRRPIPRIFTCEEVFRLLEAPLANRRSWHAVRDRALLELFYGTGMRAGEVSALEPADLDLADLSLFIRASKGQPRKLPFGERVRDALATWLPIRSEHLQPDESALFVSVHGARLQSASLALIVGHYGQAQGLPGVTPHALRRAFATHLLENGADIAQIKALLGHRDLSSTVTYAQVLPTELFKSYRKAHPRARSQSGKRR